MKHSNFDLSQLSPVKQQLLQKLLQEKLASRSEPPAQVIPHVAEQEEVPLSFAQQRLWFLDQLGANNSPYHISAASHLKGSLHLQVLEKSIQEIIRRHSVLRTIFVNQDGHPVQVVKASIDLMMHVIDLTALPAFAQEYEQSQLMRLEAQQPFDLAHGPLLRVTLLRLQNDEYILQVTLHHIVADGWSLGIFTDELSKFYTAFYSVASSYPGQPQGFVPDLPIQYADFARWQREWLQGEVLQQQLNYWRKQLAGAPRREQVPFLQLPTDRPRPAVQSFAGARQARLLAPALLQQLKKLSQQENVTLFMTLLAAFQALLMHYSGMSDIVVGTPIANRGREELEGLIGLFVNMLVLRTDLSGNPSFQQLLQRVQTTVLQAYDHQELPFEKLVEDLQPERHLSYQPIFQVGFILQNFPTPRLELPELAWSPIEVEHATSQFDLSLFLIEEERGLLARLEYSTDLFNATTMERLLGHWQVLLEAIVCDPQQQIETLPLLTEEERAQLLMQWNVAREASPEVVMDFPSTLCLHQLFERQVERVPDTIAVVFEDVSLTYHELNYLATQLAHYLPGIAEVGPDVLIGIYMERSLELIIALLAVLKAGGAYVPLDPQLPQERFIFLLEDAQIPVVLTQAHLRDSLPPLACKMIPIAHGRHVVQGAGLESRAGLEPHAGSTPGTIPTSNPHCWVEPENLAYVIYTSGSTGQPKGVQVTHANVSRLFMATADNFHFQSSDVWMMFHSFAFDFSVWEIWGALLSGGRLVVVPYWLSRSPDAFWLELMHQHVTILSQTPSAFQQLMQIQNRRDCALRLSDLRAVVFGGEALAPDSLEPWVQYYGDEIPQLINMYGITETTVHVTYRRLYEAEIRGKAASMIGQPLADLELYVLDKRQQLVPIGVPGELYVGGAGLARGYLNRPDLTAERFIPHPFVQAHPSVGAVQTCDARHTGRIGTSPIRSACPQPGARLYRTGDLVRYRETGELEYLGRVDRQVKLRGFRIELGEIEATLRAAPGVRDVVVVLREVEQGQASPASPKKHLVAYAIPVEESLTASTLQEYLRERLPDYMIPARVIFLETIPLTSNGKVDRNALPTISEQRESAFELPRSESERTLATIWQQVLGLEQVSIHDNFFALGGDSILSMQIIARARQAGLGKLTPKQIFQHQTIAQLAVAIGLAPMVEPAKQSYEWLQAEISGPVPLTPIQHWFFEQDLPQSQHFNQSLMLQLPSNWRLQHLQQVLNGWLMQHDALRLRYERTGAGWSQRLISLEEAGSVPIEHSDLTQLAPDEQASAIEEIANRVQASLHLKLGPLLRVVIFELGHGQPAQLLIVIHHLAIDGVSWRVLLEDLQQAMTRLCTGEQIALPTRTASFQHWAEHVQKLSQFALQKDRTYWLKAAQIPTVSLPLDFPEGNNLQASARTVSMALTREETHLLLRNALRPYHSHVLELLLVALLQTLGHWIGTEQIRLDLEGHGREVLGAETPDVSRTVGWFTSLYPVVFTLPQEDVDGDIAKLASPTVHLRQHPYLQPQWIKTIKEQVRSVPHKGISHGLLRYVGGDQKLREQLASAAPSQVSFNYLGQFDQLQWSSSSKEETLQPIDLLSEANSGPENPRSHLLDVNALIVSDQLHLKWTYSEQLHRQATIEALAQEFMQALRDLLAHCLEPSAGGWTPSDFPLAHLDQATLDRLLVGRENLIEDLYPLTPLQQGLLFHTLYAPQSGIYIEQVSCTLLGKLEITCGLAPQAWQQVIRRHAILRTALAWDGLDEPLQVVYKYVTMPLSILDWRSREPSRQQADLEALLLADRMQGFDLEQAPWMRLTLVQLSETRTQMVWTHHHLMLDGWSLSLVLQEVLACYEAEMQGRSLVREESRLYRDYISWLAEQESGAAEEYWRQTLAGIAAPTPLGIERKSVGHSPQLYAEELLLVSAEETARWQEYTQQQHLTLNTLIQAAWTLILSRYSGQTDVVFGNVVAGRPPELTGVERMVGLFINTVPVRVQVNAEEEVESWMMQLQEQQIEQRSYEHSSLVQIQGWSEMPREQTLFKSLLVFENYPVQVALAEQPEDKPHSLAAEGVKVVEQTNYPLTIFVVPGTGRDRTGAQRGQAPSGPIRPLPLRLYVSYDCQRFERAAIERLLGHLQHCVQQLVANPRRRLAEISLLTEAEREHVACGPAPQEWNATEHPMSTGLPVHQLFEQQVEQTPDSVALICGDEVLTYAELNQRAHQLAHHLQHLGVGPEILVGICLERSVEMVVGLLAVLKAGGAYVPLDPTYPAERLAWILADAQPAVVLTQQHFLAHLPDCGQLTLCFERLWETLAAESPTTRNLTQVGHTAYVIYTSGSTGTPKGVMISHHNVVNFFRGMDEHFGRTTPGIWMAVTSISFDISVLELFWTLTRGFQVVLHSQTPTLERPTHSHLELSRRGQSETDPASPTYSHIEKDIAFSLFYFASEAAAADGYHLLLEGAKFADQHGFQALWTPERHFHEFGGLYPNPSVTGAAVAAITKHIQIRAGSVVLPLHNPIRVAEEWAVVDNLSRGRVGIAFASGWHANDFVFAPDKYAQRREMMQQDIETVRKLWRGETIMVQGGTGNLIAVKTLPRPVQTELPVWITSAGSIETFRLAGETGAYVLTHLLGQDLAQLAAKIAAYREAWHRHGHDAQGQTGHVTLMIHTFIGTDLETVRAKVRQPFRTYLRSSLDLIQTLAQSQGLDINANTFHENDMQTLLDHAFERYFASSGLMGTVDSCLPMIENLKAIGVDELACLIDFGIAADEVLASLQHLEVLKERSNRKRIHAPVGQGTQATERDTSLSTQLLEYGISHLQCTPSLMNMLLLEPLAATALQSLCYILLGGEQLPHSLAKQIQELTAAKLHNMYGPTETTIWSTTTVIDPAAEEISLGNPIVNTQIYLLDAHLQPVPIGVAGEIYIGGAGLARGYLNRADLTAERFLPDPWDKHGGGQLYRTGDIARYDEDGTLEALGRRDQQVKLRGYRIELGEIEATLRTHPAIHEAVVLLHEEEPDKPTGKILIAYVVAVLGKERPTYADLHAHLRRQLPQYMLPASIVFLAKLPLTPNGKIDRKTLLVLEENKPLLYSQAETPLVPPQTPLQEQLATIWLELLHLPQVSIHSNFFALGGHSLLAAQLMVHIQTTFQVKVPLRSLFETPTIAEMAAIIEHIQNEITQQEANTQVAISKRLWDATPIPLSFAQERLWFLDQLAPNSAQYVVSQAFHVSGPLHVEALEHSLTTIVQRHEVLRTTFSTHEGQPIQVIASDLAGLQIPVIDLSGRRDRGFSRLLEPYPDEQPLSAPANHSLAGSPEALSLQARDQQVKQLARADALRPFDLAIGPLLRVQLLRIQEQEHVLLFTLHHIISDGRWSMGILVRELSALYQAALKGKPAPLPALPFQYADYAIWQRQQFQDEILESQLAYWQRQLSGAPIFLQLPTDRPHPAVRTDAGSQFTQHLSPALLQALTDVSQQEEATLFMTLLAAFQILLMRYSGMHDIVVGTPITDRRQAGLEDLIGFFVNTLVLRTNLSGNPSFRQLLARVREVALQAYAHQELPFEKLVESLQIERSLSHTPLFQVLFVMQNVPSPDIKLANLTWSPTETEHFTTRFDLSLIVTPGEKGLLTEVEYSTDLFDAATITRLLSHWQVLLEEIVRDPEQPIEMLPLLTETEREQVLARGAGPTVQWNATTSPISSDLSLHQLFELQVEQTPEAIAMVFENQQLTYQQLNSQANQLAYHLHKAGIGPDKIVGVCMERSLELVTALLAVLKAGGAYVPLDPGYPQERLLFLLEDTQVPVVLTQVHLRDRLSRSTAEIISLASGDITSPENNLASSVQADNLAYMIYTSGSTGKPKGVMNTHRGICNRIAWMQQTYHLTTEDRVLQKTPFSFDVSVWEFFWPLITGACLIVAAPGGHQDPTYLKALIAEEAVTTLHFVPSMLQIFLAEQNMQSCESLRQVMSSGEALTASLQANFFNHTSQEVQLHNLYGPTETAIDVTYWPCRREGCKTLEGYKKPPYGVPIGRPIANIQIYLLDQNFQPVPIGVTGELYIGGVGLARGYAGQPALTATRFIPNPFAGIVPCSNPGTCLYRTGDLARHRADGAIEYLGRIDQQVKIRGFRIELGEIETVLLAHLDIRETVVQAWEDTPGDKRLAAYVVAEGSKQFNIGNLRQYLQNKLPDYMIPAIFTLLEELPRTPNGKLDRAALPIPEWARLARAEALVPARTPTEEVLSAIWASVLSTANGSAPQVGIHDNFFALGGDSIRSIQVLSQARERGIHFSLQQLFREQTIHGLVQVLGTEIMEGLVAEPVQAFSFISPQDVFPTDVEDAYPLTRLQAGMVFHSQYHLATYHDIFSFHLVIPYRLQQLQTALEKLAACHPILRTSFDLGSFHEPLQLVHRNVTIPLQLQDISMLSPIEQEEMLEVWLEEEKSRPFVWTQPPLLRFQIHLRSETSLQLTLSFHHAVLDGWSAASLLSELMKTYLSLLSGDNASFLAPLRMQFRDFVAWEQKVIANQETKQYWQKILYAVTSARLPRWAKVRPESAEVYVLPVPISSETGTRLKNLAHKLAVPLKSVLLAAHLKVLSLLHGQTDVLTGLVSNVRPEIADGERTLGLFLNTLPFRLHLSGGTWSELIRETFAAECELLPYRWYPLSEIQQQSGIQVPFETLFNFVHFHVYQSLLAIGKAASPVPFQVLGSNVFEKTNFTLVATFAQDLIAADIIHLSLQCDTKELCPEQIEAIGNYYAQVLVELAREPEGHYEWQTPLSIQEQEQILAQWNATQVDYLQDFCLHQFIERQAEQTLDSVALVFEEQQLTYQQLNSQANQLAHHLIGQGIGPEMLVGVYMERSLELVIALLAILKAGGAYVPLDLGHPQERINFLLEDARIAIVLTQPHLHDRLLSSKAETISVTPSHLESRDNPVSLVQPDNLAYMMYTSGSTGKPKAVMITHRNAATMIQWGCHFFAKDDLAGILASTSISFDLSVFELFVPLSAGGTIVLAENLLQLPTLPAASGVTLVNTVPSVLSELLRMSSLPTSVQTVNLAGEPVPHSLVQKLYQQATIQRVFNLYGPSEDTTYSTVAAIERSTGQPIPIGRPIANTQTYLLDKHLMPVPIGVTGTLYLGGEGLARGYAGQPELTAERFVPNPFVGIGLNASGAGARLYNTGDLARYLPDGTIEYLGRVDQQVKLRGFRIELGEIETTLMSHPTIQKCVVLVREDPPEEKQLAAYLVVRQEPPTGFAGTQMEVHSIPTALRSYLQDRLPLYMIPATFVLLDTLPLTPNGKVDRRALALQTPPTAFDNRTVVAPRNHVEKILATLWQDLLHLEQVSITDNFFAVGGHSLLAVRLLNRINQQFGETQLSLTTLLQVPTIEQIAALVQKEVRSLSTSTLVTIQPVAQAYKLEEKRPFFCVHDGTGSVYGVLDLVKHLRHDRPFYGIQAPGLNIDYALFNSIEEMATAYIAELLAIQPVGPYFLGGHSFGGLVAFEMARQLQARGHAIALLALLDSYPSEPDASTSVERTETNPTPTGIVKDYAKPMMSIVKELNHHWQKQVSLSSAELSHLQPDEQLAYLLERLKEAQVVPNDTDISQPRRYIQVHEAHGSCLRKYRPQPYAGRITLLQSADGEHDPSVWTPFSAEPVEVHTVAGDHVSMVTEPYVTTLAIQLQQCLDKAEGAEKTREGYDGERI